MLTLLINETKPLAGLFASTTGGIGSVPDISVADEGQAVSVQTFTRTAGVITDSFVAGDVLHIGIGDGVNAPVCYIELSSASPATGTMAVNTVGMVALFAATVANRLSLQVGVVRTRGGNTNTIFSAPIVIHRSVIDPDTAVPTPSILGTGVAAALLVAINTALGFVRLDASARLPAVDGSQLTNVPNELPSQTGNSGKYLTTNGTATSWATVTGVSDGDKGDITVSNSGATWTIDNDTITLAKLAHMTTARVVGRTTAGTGTPELLTISGTGSVAMTNSPTFTTPNLDTPSAIVLTNATGTASININGTVGATTPSTIAGTTGTFDSTVTVGANSQDGTLNVKASGGTTTASIDGSDGSASFASGYFTVDSVGGINSVTSISAGNGVTVLDSGGTASFNSGTITLGTNTGTAAWIHSDGSARFSGGNCTINPDGDINSYGQISFGAGNGILYGDGSASFASGGLIIDQSGNITTNSVGVSATLHSFSATDSINIGIGQAGTLNVKDSGGNTTASISGADGSASFAFGGCTIGQAGGIDADSLYSDWVRIGGVNGNAGTFHLRDNSGSTTASISGADGSASFGSGALTIDNVGYLTTNGFITANKLTSYYDVVAGNGSATLYGDGSASFGSGAVTLGTNTGSAAWIHGDGSASFASGTFTATTSLLLGTAGSAVGTIGFNNATSGTTTLEPATGALGTGTVTLPLTGTLATLAGTETLTNKRITQRSGTATSSATPTINTDNVDFYSLTAQAADITSFTTNLSGTPTEGQTLWIAITGTAARAITWGATFEAGAVALPTTTVSTDRLDVAFVWNTVSLKWRCMASG